MLQILKEDIARSLQQENPWWSSPNVNLSAWDYPERSYLASLCKLVENHSIRRAVVLMGPRRVGKTIMLYQTVRHLLQNGVHPTHIMYISLDTPVYLGMGLEQFLQFLPKKSRNATYYVIYDEIQYLPSWEQHLKNLVDKYPDCKFIASGSAAAALKLKSQESGAGRFTDFYLPPLTFAEFIHLTGQDSVLAGSNIKADDPPEDIENLNNIFIDYLNYGGYPEVALSPDIRKDMTRFVRSDIIDKVLLRDLPSLYGITDTQELNRFFTLLAYNTAQEVSLDKLSQASHIDKNTLSKYLDYLEAAFLIQRLYRIDQSGRRLQRQRTFKVYLTNPSMRAALFGPVKADEPQAGHLVETAILSQWKHTSYMSSLAYYKDTKNNEIDLIALSGNLFPIWAYEIKWSDNHVTDHDDLHTLLQFSKRHHLIQTRVSTRTLNTQKTIDGIDIIFKPASWNCFVVGQNLTAENEASKSEEPLTGLTD